MVDDTVECVSVEGSAAPVRDKDRRDQRIARYLAKYRPIAPDLSADFLRGNVMVEFAAERAFAVIEREEEFSTRPTLGVRTPGLAALSRRLRAALSGRRDLRSSREPLLATRYGDAAPASSPCWSNGGRGRGW